MRNESRDVSMSLTWGQKTFGEIANVVRLTQQIAAEAEQISLLSANARVLATRVGSAALGFGEVSRQMGSVSHELIETMKHLQNETFVFAKEASLAVSNARRTKLLQAAFALVQKLDNADETTRFSTTAPQSNNFKSRRDSLLLHLQRLNEHAMFEVVLSRKSQVEAAGGGSWEPDLSRLSSEFSQAADGIGTIIVALRKALHSINMEDQSR